jgi:hypothetical protein
LYVPALAGGAATSLVFTDSVNQPSAVAFGAAPWRVLVAWGDGQTTLTNLTTGASASAVLARPMWGENKRIHFGVYRGASSHLNGSIRQVVVGRTKDGCSL